MQRDRWSHITFSSFGVWICLILALIAILLWQWRRLEPEVESTALIVAAKQMTDSANKLKQYWLVNGQPEFLMIEQQRVDFTANGWPLVLKTVKPAAKQVDCYALASVLMAGKKSIFIDDLNVFMANSSTTNYRCIYSFDVGKSLDLSIKSGTMSIRASVGNRELTP
ncbi:hypothetical protein MHO82_16800 [Vibrio sp. Of7-15]|uniref:hypothetical protein n=1 Tax=Vibrio sp. Of7-15 TaxID=2724879 RepID=UPI001EF162D5|nr:hypothetical protein [Vibrio sp. Of7-15]MCG7498529.1 hypothetical protein [Vibrio sp. Of7-15]